MNNEVNRKKVAVVSGGMGYVGSEIVKKLASDGMGVAVLFHRASESVDRFIADLPRSGHKAYQCDLENADDVKKTIEAIERNQGIVFACVHAAGTEPKRKQLHLSSVEDLQEQFAVNVFGSFNFLSACALRLKEHGDGVIIGITTAAVVSEKNTRSRGAYSPMKFALQGMLVAMKEELSAYHVRVYSVAPGVMPGGMNSATPQAFLDMVREKSPTKKIAQASDVAGVVSFLCSPESINLTNLTLLVAPESGAM